MATFTMELREVVEATDDHIGLDDYPIFDPEYRVTLNDKIKRHFWFDEIGHETVNLFIHQMKTKMHEIMPRYNQLYLSEKLTFDPLSTIDINNVVNGTTRSSSETRSDIESTSANEGVSTTANVNDALSRSVASELPSTRLAGNEDYATGATDTTGRTSGTGDVSESSAANASSATTGEATSEDEVSSSSRTSGYSGSPAELLIRYRESIINVDLMIIEELKPLFMQLWSSGGEYSHVPRGRYGYGWPYGF